MPRSVEERFWEKVEKTDLCWLWTAGCHRGYGAFWDGERQVRAHRFAYERLVGPIPDGLQLDHLCRNRSCVNPDHLEVVTPRENTLRGEGKAARQARQTHCRRGHPLSGDNLKIASQGQRQCRTCLRMLWKKREDQRTAARRASRRGTVRPVTDRVPSQDEWVIWRCPECGTESVDGETHRREYADPPCPGLVERVCVVRKEALEEARAERDVSFDALNDHAMPLLGEIQARARVLEAERDRYRAALERVESHGAGFAVKIAREVLSREGEGE